MKRKAVAIPLFLALFLHCSGLPERDVTDRKGESIEISLSFNTESYPWILGTKYPQLAVWVQPESIDSKTIFVTSGAAKNDWYFADERPGSLPVWFGVQQKDKNIEIDAISGATPSGEVHTITWKIPESYREKEVTVFIEANVSFDYNDFYTKDENSQGYSDVNGQPSIIWKSKFIADDQPHEITPEIIGHGHVSGKNHLVDPDMSNITTAAELFSYITVSYRLSAAF